MSWADGGAIPSPEEEAQLDREYAIAKASLQESARKAGEMQAAKLAELARAGASLAGIELPPEVTSVLRAARSVLGMLSLAPLEAIGVKGEHKKTVTETAEIIEKILSAVGA